MTPYVGSCKIPRVVRQKNVVVSPVGLETGVRQQEFTQLMVLGWGIGPSQGLYIGRNKQSKNADSWTRKHVPIFSNGNRAWRNTYDHCDRMYSWSNIISLFWKKK
jgi:hypothetical protein